MKRPTHFAVVLFSFNTSLSYTLTAGGEYRDPNKTTAEKRKLSFNMQLYDYVFWKISDDLCIEFCKEIYKFWGLSC